MTEIDLVEFRGELSQQRAMRLENSVRRNMNKTNNELVYQCMHWFDDKVFADYPTWDAAEQGGIFTTLDLEEFFGKPDENGKGNYAQCVESGIGRKNIAKFTGLNENIDLAFNPIQIALDNPRSRSAAIRGFCCQCVGFPEPGWREEVKRCTADGRNGTTACCLHSLRPYKLGVE